MINLLLSETKRSETYLKYIQKNKINISVIIYFAKIKKNLYKIVKNKNFSKKIFFVKTNTVNSTLVEKALLKINNNYPIIYSGYPGEIIKNKKILKEKLIHFHPGDLPLFKGSTTLFYSLILQNKVTVTCFRMTKLIDNGIVLYKKKFKKPTKLSQINSFFDDKIRAETMIEFLKKGKKKYKLKKNMKKEINFYHIAHPIVRGIVTNKKKIKQLYA